MVLPFAMGVPDLCKYYCFLLSLNYCMWKMYHAAEPCVELGAEGLTLIQSLKVLFLV